MKIFFNIAHIYCFPNLVTLNLNLHEFFVNSSRMDMSSVCRINTHSF